MALRFATDDQDAISRRIAGIQATPPGERDIRQYYEIERCLEFISSQPSFKKVALQFPDHLLCNSVAVTTTLARESGSKCFILGDTSYGSCCVDEVAASHAAADCIIHFGPSCLTQTRRLPVLYVFGREEVRVEECESVFRGIFPDLHSPILLLSDTPYRHCIAELRERLSDYHLLTASQISLPLPVTPSPDHTHSPCCCDSSKGQTQETSSVSETATATEAGSYNRFGRSFKLDRPVEQVNMFYIGREGRTLTNLLISYNKSQFYSYDPVSELARREDVTVNKALGRRYYLVQKAKEARTVGILVGTLGAAESLKVIQRLKIILKQAGKKFYTVAVGKLNVAKMANFMEIEIFVLVACPENSLVDSQEFYRPVVTPFEMEVACLRSREWSGEVVTDYRELFSLPVTTSVKEEEEEEPEFSLISGGLLPTRHLIPPDEEREEEEEEGAVAVRSKMNIALPHSTAAEFLSGRGWKGLERRLGEGGVALATEGRRGVASAYSHEHHTID